MSLGLKLDKKKEYIQGNVAITSTRPSSKVTLAFPKASSAHMEWCVRPGDQIKTGEMIARPVNASAGFLHSSVTGTVSRFLEVPHAFGGRVPAVEITVSLREEWAELQKSADRGNAPLRREALLEVFSKSGLLTLDDKEEFLHASIQRESLPLDGALILNACESEPYVTSQTCLLFSHPLEILKGADVLRQALQVERVVIVCEADAEEAIEILRSKIYFLKWKNVDILKAGILFPQDDPRLLKRLIRAKYGLAPEKTAVYPAAAAYFIHEAVMEGKPFTQKVVTLAGECMAESRNVWVRLGVLSEDLFRMGKGMLREPGKRVAGGPMRGCVLTESVPVSGSVHALLALPKELTQKGAPGPCLRCGHCLEVCPAEISPALITLAAEFHDWKTCEKESAQDCLECGNCTYVCPAARPLAEWLTEAKAKLPREDFLPFADNSEDTFLIKEAEQV